MYIVTFAKGTAEEIQERHLRDLLTAGGDVSFRYKLVGGFAGHVPEAYLSVLRASPDVAAIEADQKVSASGGGAKMQGGVGL